MLEISLPLKLHIKLDDSFLFNPEFSPVTGGPVPQGTSAATKLKNEISQRISRMNPQLGLPDVRGDHSISSFVFNGAIVFTFENLDLIAANALIVSSYDRIFREVLLSIQSTFKKWDHATIEMGSDHDPKRTTAGGLPIFRRWVPSADLGLVLGVPIGDHASIDVRTNIPSPEPNPSHARSAWQTYGKAIAQGLVFVGAVYLLVEAQNARSRASEEKIVQAIQSNRPVPAQLTNEVTINMPPATNSTAIESATPAVNEEEGCIRIIKNGKETSCQ